MRLRSVFALAVILSPIGCGNSKPASADPKVSPARNPKIPAEVSYPIIKDEDWSSKDFAKRVVSVRLNMRISPDALREVALEVKAAEKHQYEETLMYLYLPEAVPGVKNAPWATCHLRPTLEVKILGLTIEQEAAYRKIPITHPGKRIGAWLLEGQGESYVDLIYEDGGKFKYSLLALNGERLDDDMVELPSENGRKFKRDGSDDVYEVDFSGTLRLHGHNDKITAAALPLK